MHNLIDQFILDLFEGLFLALRDHLSVFTSDAQALCAIFMLLYFGIKSYGMIAGDDRLEIMPLLRPFALAMVIMLWSPFVDLINFPLKVVTDKSRALFDNRIGAVDAVSQQRMALIDSVATKLIESSAELEEVQKGANDEAWYESLGIDFNVLFDQMKGYFILIMAKFRFFFVQIIEYLVITIFQLCSYLIFFLQIIFAGILIILGPFSFAFSVLPGFKDAYIYWLARYISVSLYSAIGYIIMGLSMVLVQYGMEREIELLRYVLNNEAAFIFYVSQNDGGSNFFIVTLLIGGLAMLSVPIISTWIISTSGVGSAISTISRGAARIARMAS
ncbi:MAG: plasmid transfer protein [Cyclobacteriaceae bacterium]|nr:plasmid transfer protein [Cyclobacteriaceae bacterium]